MGFAIDFVRILAKGCYYALPLFILLGSYILVMGILVGRLEKWPMFDSVYFALTTALTIGYGDIVPLKKRTRMIAITIALAGLVFTGLFVSLSLHSGLEAFRRHASPDMIEKTDKMK